MIEFSVEIQNDALIPTMMAGIASQLPFATAVAINKTLDSAQAAIRQTLPDHFTVRRADFVDKTIYIGPKDRAKKDNLVGTVRVNPERDFLAKFETDTVKRPRSGKSLAVPIVRASDKSMIITRSDPISLKRVMQAINDKQGQLKGRRRKGQAPIAASSVYLVKSAKGTFVIQRTGPGSTRVLYAFEKSVPIEPDLHFDETAMATALESWPENVLAAIDYAIGTAR